MSLRVMASPCPESPPLPQLPDAGFLRDWVRENRRIEIELGCARGRFLLAMAELHPDRRFVGIERLSHRVARCENKIAAAGLTNARVLRCDAAEWVAALPESSVDVLHVPFPDPWPKRRHAPRRLLQPGFFPLAARALKPGGRLRFLTDNEPYFRQVEGLVAGLTGWKIVRDGDTIPFPPSEFEARFAASGARIHRLALENGTGP